MSTRDKDLEKYTYKNDVEDLRQRVFYILMDVDNEPMEPKKKTSEEYHEELKEHRMASAIALLLAKLSDKGLLSEDEIDDILLGVAS